MPKVNTAQSLSCNPIKNGIIQLRFTKKAFQSRAMKSLIKRTWENWGCLLCINKCTKHTRISLQAQLDFTSLCTCSWFCCSLQTDTPWHPISIHTGVLQIPQFPGELAVGAGGGGLRVFPPCNLHLTSHLAPTAPPRTGAQASLQLIPWSHHKGRH